MDSKTEIFLKEGRFLIDWLLNASYASHENIQVMVNTPETTRIKFFTNDHYYQIKATPTYLGCQAGTRKPRVGEDHTRGNDLPDGKFSKETFDKIILSIVGYELKKIAS